jgi:hypothetical protein
VRARIASIENIIAQDPGHRKIFFLTQRDHLRLAALSLLGGKRVLIASGFPILKAKAGETDGPPGALALGQALRRLGKEVSYITDSHQVHLFKGISAEPVMTFRDDLLERGGFSHLVAVERPARARDGRYYNMRGEDITALVEPIDELFRKAESHNVVTIGIGDGGNEVGMGRVFKGVMEFIQHGQKIASAVLTDYVVVSGVSNWGAYGLVAALSVLTGKDLLPSGDEIRRTMESLAQAGAVDGVSGLPDTSVDGLPLQRTVELVEEMRWHLLPAPLGRVTGLKVGVIGAGTTGIAVARLLLRKGAQVRISEKGEVSIPGDLSHCPVEMGGHTLQFMEGVDLVVRSPGVDPRLPFVRGLWQRGIPVLSEMEAAFEMERPQLVAVTGSVGKRTTVELLSRIMSRLGRPMPFGGNKGKPLSELLLEEEKGPIALAVSSFQLESVLHFRPHIVAILNVLPLHLDRHGDPMEIVRTKSRVFMNQGPEDILILNRDEPKLRLLEGRHWGETLWISAKGRVERGAWMAGGKIFLSPEGDEATEIPCEENGIPPEPFMVALLSAWCLGADVGELRDVARGLGSP